MNSSLITPVIICGGTGTRLWPLSRESQPKQFFPLAGGASTFQQVLARVADPEIFGRPIVVTNVEFRFTVADQAQRAGASPDIVLEPAGRNSGPAIAVAAELAGRRDRECPMLVLAADHIVRDADGFRRACRGSAQARAGRLSRHVWCASARARDELRLHQAGGEARRFGAHVVEAFVEKPNEATASRYVAEGFLWNSGNFMFRADRMLDELNQFEPEMRAAANIRWTKSRAISTFFACPKTRSCARPRNQLITPLWNAPRTLPCCRSTSDGRILEVGARFGRSSSTTNRAIRLMVRRR